VSKRLQQTVGVLFDLDGTLVDSKLDFDAIRREMELAPGIPILEAFESMPPDQLAHCRQILDHHEQQGALRATLLPGVVDLLNRLTALRTRMAIVTRNGGSIARDVLARLGIVSHFDPIISRDDGPVKPDPWAIEHICKLWKTAPSKVVMVGDFHFDITTGRRAGARTVLLARGRDRQQLQAADEANLVVDSFERPDAFVRWLGVCASDGTDGSE